MGDEFLALDHSTINPVVTIGKLNDTVCRIPHSTVITNCHILKCLDQATLDVTRFSSLHSSVNQTLATSHCMEKELVCCKATQVRVLHKASAFWCKVILCEVGQSAVAETERNTLTFHTLLSHASRHLRDINERTLRTGNYHLLDIVVVRQTLFGVRSDIVTSLVQDTIHICLERLTKGHTSIGLEPVVTSVLNKTQHVVFGPCNGRINIARRCLISDSVTNADRKAIVQQPKVYHALHTTEEVAAHDRTTLTEDNVDQTTCGRANDLFVENTVHDVTVLNVHTIVAHKVVRSRLGITQEHVDTLGNAHGQNLLARPVRLGLDNTRLWHHAIPV